MEELLYSFELGVLTFVLMYIGANMAFYFWTNGKRNNRH